MNSRGPSSSNYQTVQKKLQLKTFELIQGGLSSANSADQLRDSQSTPLRPLEVSNRNWSAKMNPFLTLQFFLLLSDSLGGVN